MKKLAAFLFLVFIVLVVIAADTNTLPSFLRDLYRFPGGDLTGHFLLYGILAFLLARAFPHRLQVGRASLNVTSLWVSGLALAEEFSQFFFPQRTPSLLDLACGLLGILLADRFSAPKFLLPIMSNSSRLCIICPTKRQEEPMPGFVRDWMQSPVVVIDPDSSVSYAMTLMRRRRIHSLIVDLGSEGSGYGILTTTDISGKIVAAETNPAEVKVRDIMTAPVITGQPGWTLKEASQVMQKHKFHHLPIEENGVLVGIISDTDIFMAVEEIGWKR